MTRKEQFTLKDFHNLFLLTMSQAPVIVLATRKLTPYADTYLPEAKWAGCLQAYYRFFAKHQVRFYEYDCTLDDPFQFLDAEKEHLQQTSWWVPMWQAGNAANGNTLNPTLLICAQNLGPNNVNNIVFEGGPTGILMSEFLEVCQLPLGQIAITNLVKAPRQVTRPVEPYDLELFSVELTHMKPKAVLLMGAVAKGAGSLVSKHNIPYAHVPHLGYYHRKGIRDMTRYYNEWKTVIDSLLNQGKPKWQVTVE